MLDTFLITINEWITAGSAISALGCFIWGMISVLFSPCHLASIPLIIAYVGGQHRALSPKQASTYAALFTLGLFITIAVIGIICALLGRMLGDVGNYWQILIGLVLVWVALGMLGVEKCAMSGSLLYRLKLKGRFGAFALGLAYGVLSGSCTFGFIAPILAIITIQQRLAAGMQNDQCFRTLSFAMGDPVHYCRYPAWEKSPRVWPIISTVWPSLSTGHRWCRYRSPSACFS
jgi:cytochrome c-type biogenesis protein